MRKCFWHGISEHWDEHELNNLRETNVELAAGCRILGTAPRRQRVSSGARKKEKFDSMSPMAAKAADHGGKNAKAGVRGTSGGCTLLAGLEHAILQGYHLGQIDYRNAWCRFYFFELIKTVMTVIQCLFIFFELIKTVMGIHSLAGYFFLVQMFFFFLNRHHHNSQRIDANTDATNNTTKTTHTNTYHSHTDTY